MRVPGEARAIGAVSYDENKGVIPRFGIALALALACAMPAAAQSGMSLRLSESRVGDVASGSYVAGDSVRFALDPYGDKYLLRFDGDPEVFVLYADHVALGGRMLRYDSGTNALLVSSFGAMTLYTDSRPSGLPAMRDGDSFPPVLPQLSLPDMQSAAQDEAEHLAYSRQLSLAFTADWGHLANDPGLRAITFDAMQNAARGLDRFAASSAAHAALSQKVDSVKMVEGGKPTISLSGRTLVVTFDAARGYAGRASSRAIARALGKLLSVPVSEEASN